MTIITRLKVRNFRSLANKSMQKWRSGHYYCDEFYNIGAGGIGMWLNYPGKTIYD